jgi:hypothetical protein
MRGLINYRCGLYFRRVVADYGHSRPKSETSDSGANRMKFNSDPIFMDNGKYTLNNTTMVNFISVCYFCGVGDKPSVLDGLSGLSAFAEWALFPAKFDYALFDVRWLAVLNYEHALKKMSKVKKIGILLKRHLDSEYNAELAEIYLRYFSKN